MLCYIFTKYTYILFTQPLQHSRGNMRGTGMSGIQGWPGTLGDSLSYPSHVNPLLGLQA